MIPTKDPAKERKKHGRHRRFSIRNRTSIDIVAQLLQHVRQVEKLGRVGAVEEPENAEQVILPAEFAPVAQGARGQLREWIASLCG
jgi:hypothetical protein